MTIQEHQEAKYSVSLFLKPMLFLLLTDAIRIQVDIE